MLSREFFRIFTEYLWTAACQPSSINFYLKESEETIRTRWKKENCCVNKKDATLALPVVVRRGEWSNWGSQ